MDNSIVAIHYRSLACSHLSRSGAVRISDHQVTLARRSVKCGVRNPVPIGRKRDTSIRHVEKAARSAAENRNLVHLAIPTLHGNHRVIQKVPVGSKSNVGDNGASPRKNLHGARDGYYPDPKAELPVPFQNIGEVTAV